MLLRIAKMIEESTPPLSDVAILTSETSLNRVASKRRLLRDSFILFKLIIRFEQIHEYIFLLAIAWCLGVAEFANLIGLSHEIGAFIAGVTLASSPIALFITERLKPLRDFFLIIFFFSLGAGFNISIVSEIYLPAITLALIALIFKPLVFSRLLYFEGEKKNISDESGIRLGQISEFSLLISVLAVQSGFIGEHISSLIQFSVLISFILSSYIIVLKYPTPISSNDLLDFNLKLLIKLQKK